MKASKLRPHLGYHLLGCQCMIKKCHQMVQAKAIRATQLDHTLSKADTSAGQGDLLPNVLCEFLGSGLVQRLWRT